jgi:hypothetical protein
MSATTQGAALAVQASTSSALTVATLAAPTRGERAAPLMPGPLNLGAYSLATIAIARQMAKLQSKWWVSRQRQRTVCPKDRIPVSGNCRSQPHDVGGSVCCCATTSGATQFPLAGVTLSRARETIP